MEQAPGVKAGQTIIQIKHKEIKDMGIGATSSIISEHSGGPQWQLFLLFNVFPWPGCQKGFSDVMEVSQLCGGFGIG